PVLLAAGPGGGSVADHRPVIDLDDILVAEGEAGRGAGVVQGQQNGDNGLPQLVFHEPLLLVVLQELSWTPTAFPPRASATPCKKRSRSGLICSPGAPPPQ